MTDLAVARCATPASSDVTSTQSDSPSDQPMTRSKHERRRVRERVLGAAVGVRRCAPAAAAAGTPKKKVVHGDAGRDRAPGAGRPLGRRKGDADREEDDDDDGARNTSSGGSPASASPLPRPHRSVGLYRRAGAAAAHAGGPRRQLDSELRLISGATDDKLRLRALAAGGDAAGQADLRDGVRVEHDGHAGRRRPPRRGRRRRCSMRCSAGFAGLTRRSVTFKAGSELTVCGDDELERRSRERRAAVRARALHASSRRRPAATSTPGT